MSVTNLSRSYISPVRLLLFSFIIISFFWIAVPYANAGNGGATCADPDCESLASCENPALCCRKPPSEDCLADGASFPCFWTGSACVNSPPEGACCFSSGECDEGTEEGCAGEGGDYQGDDTNCEPNPCAQPEGACCFSSGECADITTEATCVGEGGVYQGNDTICGEVTCPPPPSIPTLNQWGMITMAGVLGLFAVIGLFVMRRGSVVKV